MSETATVGAGEASGPAVVILSGLSGGGKTAASKLFEDLGYVVVDNLPAELLTDLADVVARLEEDDHRADPATLERAAHRPDRQRDIARSDIDDDRGAREPLGVR